MGKKGKKSRTKKSGVDGSGNNCGSAMPGPEAKFDHLALIMRSAKKNRENVLIQRQLCHSVEATARNDPGRLGGPEIGFGYEVSLAVLMALKSHPSDQELKGKACAALCAMFFTPCAPSIIRLQGTPALYLLMKEELGNIQIQRTILSTLSKIFGEDSVWAGGTDKPEAGLISHYYNKKTEEVVSSGMYPRGEIPRELQQVLRKELAMQGLQDAVVATVTAHRLDAEIQQSGGEVIYGIYHHCIYFVDTTLAVAHGYDKSKIHRNLEKLYDRSFAYCLNTEWVETAVLLSGNVIHDYCYSNLSRFPKEWCGFLAKAKILKEARAAMLRSGKPLAGLEEISCNGDMETKIEVATQGGAALVLALMAEAPSNLFVQQAGSKIMGYLTASKHPSILEAIADADGVDILLDAVFKYPKDKTILDYGGSAALLVREFENGKEKHQESPVV